MIPKLPEVFRFQSKLLRWYNTHHRKLPWRDTDDPYKIWISEVMLQQTQVATTIPYYFRFLKRFPTIKDLARADLEVVLKMWEGLGYYARARNFHKAANIVAAQMNGNIPDNPEIFRTLPGVGDYICAAVQSIAFDHPLAVVDGNVKRVLARLFCDETPVNKSNSHKVFSQTADQLLEKTNAGTFNQAMMELGALVCAPKNPDCMGCPVQEFCCADKEGKTDSFPRRLKSKKAPTYKMTAGIIFEKSKMLIVRRSMEGLLGGLWEFPSGRSKPGETPEQSCIRNLKEITGFEFQTIEYLSSVNHAYTHFKIKMDVFYCKKRKGRLRLNGPIDSKWIGYHEISTFAFHKANLKFIPFIDPLKLL